VHELRRAGLSREEIASRLKLKDFPLSRIEDQLSRFSPDELRQKLKALVETDSAVKTTRLPDNTALEMLVIELCQ
jgi:DNA polymerase III delta subunit